VAALFIAYLDELFNKSQFGFIAFHINGAPFVVIQHFPRFCVSLSEPFQINKTAQAISPLALASLFK